MSLFYVIKGRKYYYLILDIIILIISLKLSHIIRFYPDIDKYLYVLPVRHYYLIIFSFILSYYFFQIYRIIWAYSNINDVYRLILANLSGFFIFTASVLVSSTNYSRSVILLSFMFISTVTIFYRILLRDYFSRKNSKIDNIFGTSSKIDSGFLKKRILIIGAGEAGRNILSEYKKKGLSRSIIGFIDDDKQKVGKIFNGKMIYSSIKEIHDVIYKFKVNEILIAMPSAGANTINKIISIIKRENQTIPITILPSIMELFQDQPLISSVRDVSIVDLIGREEFRIDKKLIKERFENKTVLITGAGGSIGSEICKQLLKFNVKKLIAIGRGENSIYSLIKSLNEYVEFMDKKPEIIYRIIDVKDYKLLERIFDEYRPEIVFHAAAHKHVPLMEINEIEAIQNNVTGTLNVLELSSVNNVKGFVLISTDKAVCPVNIMGATKRIAEIITHYYFKTKGLRTSIVRFGNVIGSRGSVIPLFREQIEKGGPVTVTHPEVTRYFMSISEASLLVINAAAYSTGGECFVLEMGGQYKILDIAQKVIKLYGYDPGKDIKIKFTGLRPGEKLHEEICYSREIMVNTNNDKIFVIDVNDNEIDQQRIKSFIEIELHELHKHSAEELRKILKSLVPEYSYSDLTDPNMQFDKIIN